MKTIDDFFEANNKNKDNIPTIKLNIPPVVIEERSIEEIPLASIPLSQLVCTETPCCPVCGKEIDANTIVKEAINPNDNINYIICRNCRFTY